MCSTEYKNDNRSLLTGRIKKLEEIKNNVSDARSHLSKLKENRSRQKGADKESQKKEISMSPFDFYTLEFDVPAGKIIRKTIGYFNIKDESEKFLSILLNEEDHI